MKPEIINEIAEENSKDIHEFFLASKLEIEKVKRRKKQFTISLVVLCSISLVGFVFVFLLWRNSEKLQDQIENTSKANAIATKAYTLLEHDPTLAFRLAEESYKIDPTPLNKQVIMAAYAQVPFYEKLEGHTDQVRDINYSRDGKLILTSCIDQTARIWDNSGKLLAVLKGHKDALPVGDGASNFSNNGKFVVTASKDSTARLWNLNGECLAILKHNGPVNSVCFSPDDQKILTASSDKTARLWDLKGKEIVSFTGHSKGVRMARPIDNNIFLSVGADSTVRLWNLSGKSFRVFHETKASINRVFLSNKFIITGNFDGTGTIWEINGREVGNYKDTEADLINSLDVLNDSIFLTGSRNGLVCIWTIEGKLIKKLNKHTAAIWSSQFSSDGTKITTASDDGTARLWDLDGNEIMLLKGHTSQVFSAQFSPDGKQIVTASGDKTARIWTIEPEENPILKGHTGYVVDADFSPDGKKIVTAGYDYTARIWKINGKPNSILNHLKHYGVDNIGFMDHKSIFTVDGYGEGVSFWDVKGNLLNNITLKERLPANSFDFRENYKLIFTEEHKLFIFQNLKILDSVSDVIFSKFLPNGKLFYSLKADSSLRIYEIEPKDLILEKFNLKIRNTAFTSAEFSSDGKWMATTSEDSTIRIWDMEEILSLEKNRVDTSIINIGPEKVKHQIKLNAIVTSLVFSPKDNIFISNSDDNIMMLWDIEGKKLAEFVGHSDGISEINFSPDGKSIASSSFDKSLRRWNLNGKEVMNYSGHTGAINRARFSPDGKYILSCSIDHTARLMPVTIEQVLSKINKEKVRGAVYKLSEQELKVYGVK